MLGGPKSILAVVVDLIVEAFLVLSALCAAFIGIWEHDWHYFVGGIGGVFVLSAMLACRFFAGEVGWVSQGDAATDTVSTWRSITPVHFLADLGWLYLALLEWRRHVDHPRAIAVTVSLVAAVLPLLIVRLVVLVRWARGHRPKPDLTVSFYSPRSLLLASVMLVAGLSLTAACYLRFPAGFKNSDIRASRIAK